MRISTQYQYGSYQQRISVAQQRYFEAQQEVMTGRRSDLFTKDPGAGAFVLRASSLKSSIEQYQANLRSAKDYLGTTEATLADVGELLKSAYTSAVKGANSTLDQAARDALAQDVAQLQSRLVTLANARGSSGQYIFAGQESATMPFQVVAGALTYAGDSNSVFVETSAGQTMVVNTPGQALFTNAYNALEQLRLNLESGNVSAISGTDLGALQANMAALGKERGAVGARLKTVAELSTQNTRRIDDLAKDLSDAQDVDMAEAIMNLQLAESAYQASLQVATRGFSLSLMDFIQ